MDHNTEEQSLHGVWKPKSVGMVEAEHTPMHLLGIPLPRALNHKTSSSVSRLLWCALSITWELDLFATTLPPLKQLFSHKRGFCIDLPLLEDACALKHRFSWFDVLIWTFMLWSYFEKSPFFFKKCVQDFNKPKLTEMGEGFVEIILGWVTRPNLGSSVLDGWHSQYPKAFAKIH